MVEKDDAAPGSAFAKVIQGLMRPLVRALISQGITAPALYRILKQVYVDVAEQEFELDGERQTDSRISMLTGVHRRDVKALRGADRTAETATQQKVTTIASVIGRWLASPETCGPDGVPKPLPRSEGSGTTFEDLVRSVSKDIRPRTVLDELVRQGLVAQEDGVITLRAGAFLGPADPDQKVVFFAENVGDHIAAAVDNLLADDPRFMERAVFYNRLRPGSVDTIETVAREAGGELLVRLNSLANDQQSQDLDAPDGTHRFRFGIFFFREDEAATDKKPGMKNNETG